MRLEGGTKEGFRGVKGISISIEGASERGETADAKVFIV